mgnify:CR=1 FL=1
MKYKTLIGIIGLSSLLSISYAQIKEPEPECIKGYWKLHTLNYCESKEGNMKCIILGFMEKELLKCIEYKNDVKKQNNIEDKFEAEDR